MILPEDTKAPLPSDDEDDRIFFPNLSSPSHLPTALAEAYTDGLEPYDPSAPLAFRRSGAYAYADSPPPSPRSHVTVPLLADADDIGLSEFGPAPPYSALDPSTSLAARADKPSLLARARKRYRLLALAGALYVVITLATVVSTRRWGFVHRRPKPPPHAHEPEPWRPADVDDGAPVACAAYDPAAGMPFPATSAAPHLPPAPAGGNSRRSANATFVLDAKHFDVFARLTGPAGVGDVFFTTYAPGEPVPDGAIELDAEVGGAGGDGGNGVARRKATSDVRVTVEAIYDVLAGVPDDAAVDAATSPGWEVLDMSRVCLMKATNGSDPSATAPPPPRLGVGIYTALPDDTRHPNHTDALRFRLHVALPRVEPPTASASALGSVAAMADAFLAGHHPPRLPPGAVRSLAVLGGVSSFYFPALHADIGRLELSSQIGSMDVDVRAANVHLATLGDIRGKVAVSDRLQVVTPAGEIDLDLHVTVPPFDMLPPPFPFPPNSTDAPPPAPPGAVDDAVCRRRPTEIMVAANNDQATVRHVGWDAPCRGVNVLLRNMVGSSEFHPHPLYDGLFRLSTSIGEIRVDGADDDVADPLGLGRWRNVTLRKHDRVTSRNWVGEVHWEAGPRPARGARDADANVDADEGEGGEGERGEGHADEVRGTGRVRRALPALPRQQAADDFGPPPPGADGGPELGADAIDAETARGPRPFPPKLERGIVIETQVGTIDLVL
ncbi:hypothetical protein Q5752_004769 [Cryptotrichosporon argae]